MEVLNINSFLLFKTNNLVQNLDSKTLELLNTVLCLDKTKKYKKYIKKPNILKNQKIQVKKDNIINKYKKVYM